MRRPNLFLIWFILSCGVLFAFSLPAIWTHDRSMLFDGLIVIGLGVAIVSIGIRKSLRQSRRLRQIQRPLPIPNAPVSDPQLFESQIANMFRHYGYKVVQTPYRGDHGIDIKVYKDDEFAVVQCKRYKDRIGEPVLRDFYGAMQHVKADHGYIITTAGFTDAAYQWSKGKRMVLVDGVALQKMLDESVAVNN